MHWKTVYRNQVKTSVFINQTGNYYIRVYSYQGSSSTENYQIRVALSNVDGYELNDYINEAKNVSIEVPVYGTIDNVKDTDWYTINIQEKGNYTFLLQNIPANTDYDMYIYDSTGNYMFGSYLSGTSEESINVELNPGSYYVKISSFSGYSETEIYYLNTQVSHFRK